MEFLTNQILSMCWYKCKSLYLSQTIKTKRMLNDSMNLHNKLLFVDAINFFRNKWFCSTTIVVKL